MTRFPITVSEKTFYIDYNEWKKLNKWRTECEKHFPKTQEHLRKKKDEVD